MRVFALTSLVLLSACGSSEPVMPDNLPTEAKTFTDPGAAIGVVLETDLGEIHIDVYTEKAPLSAREFLYYVDKGLYNNQGFYRAVRPDNDDRKMGMSLVQAGRLDLEEFTLAPLETTKATGLSHILGSVGLAREGANQSSGKFFFINLDDNTMLNHGGKRLEDGQGFAAFGRITQGLNVAYKIQYQTTYEKGTVENQPPDFMALDDQLMKKPVFIQRAYRK